MQSTQLLQNLKKLMLCLISIAETHRETQSSPNLLPSRENFRYHYASIDDWAELEGHTRVQA